MKEGSCVHRRTRAAEVGRTMSCALGEAARRGSGEASAGPACACGRSGRSNGAAVLAGMLERLRGLNAASARAAAFAVLVPCRDVHTHGMGFPIDVAFADARGVVVEVHRRVLPGRRLRCAAARLVLERKASSDAWFEAGSNVFAVEGHPPAPCGACPHRPGDGEEGGAS